MDVANCVEGHEHGPGCPSVRRWKHKRSARSLKLHTTEREETAWKKRREKNLKEKRLCLTDARLYNFLMPSPVFDCLSSEWVKFSSCNLLWPRILYSDCRFTLNMESVLIVREIYSVRRRLWRFSLVRVIVIRGDVEAWQLASARSSQWLC